MTVSVMVSGYLGVRRTTSPPCWAPALPYTRFPASWANAVTVQSERRRDKQRIFFIVALLTAEFCSLVPSLTRRVGSGVLSRQGLKDLVHLFRCQVLVIVKIKLKHRGSAARAQTLDQGNRESAVRSRFAGLDSQLL